MSGQWEVVGKKKDKGSKPGPKIASKQGLKTKNEINGVKLEEVLPKSQVKNLFANGKNKENQPVAKKTESVQNKKASKKQEKVVEPAKPKTPKSIESALNAIDVNEFVALYENSKSHFPDAPIVWLKDIAQLLNQKVNVELHDAVFTSKPSNYPFCVVPSGIKAVIERAAKDANEDNLQLFFDISLTSLVTDMSKNLQGIGHKLLLQFIATTRPQFAVTNLNKHVVLRNSYQNRPNIGTSILWAVGQAGLKDSRVGFKVFQELMAPLIEMKNYSRFIIKYFIDLLNSPDATLTQEQYFQALDIIHSNHKNFPNDLKKDFVNLSPRLRDLLLDQEISNQLIELLLKKLPTNNNKTYQDSLCETIIKCFIKEEVTLTHWTKCYNKNIASSAILLKYLDVHWKTISQQINIPVVRTTFVDLLSANSELILRKRKEEGLNECIDLLERISAKMVSKTKSGSSCRFLFLLTTVTIGAFIYFDIKHHGAWEVSRTRKTLKDLGVCDYAHLAIDTVKEGWKVVDNSVEETFPGFHKTLGDSTEPYIELVRNFGIVLYNLGVNIKEAAAEKYPLIIQSIESHAPGLIEQSQNIWTTSVVYVNRSIDYLRTEVFVGQLSPENMQRVVFEALNTTQVKAAEYYHWIYEKVQTTIK